MKQTSTNLLVLTVKSTRKHSAFLFSTDCEDLHSAQLSMVSWAGISVCISVLTHSPPSLAKESQEHKGSRHLPVEDFLQHWHGEIAGWSILFLINKTYCALADLLSYQGRLSDREKFLRRQWQRMKGDLLGDVCQITWESKERSTLLTKNTYRSESAQYSNCRYSLLTSNAVGKVNLLMHEGIAKTWEAWKVAREK